MRSATTGVTAGADVRLFEIGTRFSPDWRNPRRRIRLDRTRHSRSLERRAARSGLLRHQGRRRTTRGDVPGHAGVRGYRARRTWSPGRAAAITGRRPRRSACSVSSRRRSPTRAICPPRMRSTSAKSISMRLSAAAPAETLRAAAAATIPVRRARHLDSRQRCLVCRNGSWHHSFGRARHADPGPRVRSVSGQGHCRRQGQPVVPSDVPVARADADRRGSAGGHAAHHRRAHNAEQR